MMPDQNADQRPAPAPSPVEGPPPSPVEGPAPSPVEGPAPSCVEKSALVPRAGDHASTVAVPTRARLLATFRNRIAYSMRACNPRLLR